MNHWTKILALVMGLCLLFGTFDIEKAYGKYPKKMITVVVVYGAGGGNDRLTRILSTAAIDHYGQAWHVVNIAGAQGIVGWKQVLSRRADGYTMMEASSTPLIAAAIEEKPPINPLNIKLVCYYAGMRSVIVSKPESKWSKWDGFKAYAKKNPGKISVGGSMSMLLMAAHMFKQEGIEVNYVPYSSTSAAVTDLLGGHIDNAAITASTVLTLVPKAVPVVNTGGIPLSKKQKEFKGVPNPGDLGHEGMVLPRFFGLHPDTPDEIVNYASEKIAAMTKDKSVKRLFKKVGEEINFIPRAQAVQEFKKLVKSIEETSKLLK
jgi:tripartite-type tricarboxylate transporter receptor subunit TctC